jgi:hypothetical protein
MEPLREMIERIDRERVERARKMQPKETLVAGPRLFDRVCRVMMDGIRHERSGVDDATVRRILQERLVLALRLANEG